MENTEKTLQQKLDALQLIPLFPDNNYFRDNAEKGNELTIRDDNALFMQVYRMDRELSDVKGYVKLEIFKKTNGLDLESNFYFSIQKFSDNEIIYKQKEEDIDLQDLPSVLNKFAIGYEEFAKEFNKILLEKVKDELEQEKKKQEEKKKEEQEQEGEKEEGEGQEGEGQEGEGQEGEGQEGENQEGENQEGEGQEGEGQEGEAKGQEMTPDQIQKMIDQISKDQEKGSGEGQSNAGDDNIDFEDFLEQVEKGNADNDFADNYDNKDLKDKIEKEKQDFGSKYEQGEPTEEELKYKVSNVLKNIALMLNISEDEVKRRFPTTKSATSFVTKLNANEINEISNNVGIPNNLSNFEKQKVLTTNLITEIQNK
jgi:uncharacterized protein (DUF433 family)